MKYLKKSVARRSGRGGVRPETDETLPPPPPTVVSLLLTVPWMMIGVASTGGASVSSRRFETLDARMSKQPIESRSDLGNLVVASSSSSSSSSSMGLNDEPVLCPFSFGGAINEYSINDEGGGTGDDEEDTPPTAGRIGSDDDDDSPPPIDDVAAGGDISDGMSIKSKLSSGCSPSVVVTYTTQTNMLIFRCLIFLRAFARLCARQVSSVKAPIDVETFCDTCLNTLLTGNFTQKLYVMSPAIIL